MELALSGAYSIARGVLVAANTASSTPASIGNLTGDNAAFNGPITLNNSLAIASQSSGGNTLTVASILNGSGTNSVTLSGPGNVLFSGSNTYNGNTTVNGGSLTVGSGSSLPATTLTVNGTSTVTLQDSSGTQPLAVLNGSPSASINLSGGLEDLVVGSGSYCRFAQRRQCGSCEDRLGHPVPRRQRQPRRLSGGLRRHALVRFHRFDWFGLREHGIQRRRRGPHDERFAGALEPDL